MNANLITVHLLRNLHRQNASIVIPNYYIGGYECDIMEVTKSGQVYEFEIKTSINDFNVDFKKGRKWESILNGTRVNRFYFVVPENLISVDMLPEKIGLIYAKKYDGDKWIYFRVVKEAKTITRNSLLKKEMIQLAINLSMKLYNAKLKLWKNKNLV